MKKILFSILTMLSFYCSERVSAQTFTVGSDTVFAFVGGVATVANTITNTTSTGFKVNWSVDTSDFPADWLTVAAFGICDNNLCYSNDNHRQLWNDTTHTAMSFLSGTYAPGVAGNISLALNLTGASLGTHYVTMNLTSTSPSYSRKITFVINKVPVAAPAVAPVSEEVLMYPNPATNEVNVVFEGNNDINCIAVYNIIGKTMNVYKVTGTSANLNLDNIPSGIYFARLFNTQGGVVATKKFTKN